MAFVISVTAFAQEVVNESVVARIKEEAFQRSEVMDTLSWLADVHGPRLTGSPTLRQAGEWARDRLTQLGHDRRGAGAQREHQPRLVDRSIFD